ncbi:MAG: adenosine deaminase [Solirubrobacterales bacterium]|nr:adenosine deaminase [Solirubrobacterales bacterium]
MRRRLALAVIAAAALLAPSAAHAGIEGTAKAIDSARHDPAALRDLLWAMPKGADLHMHLSGAVYGEEMLAYGAADGDCVGALTFAAYSPPCSPGDRPLADALTDNVFQNRILRAWSMKGFVAGDESGHDHFFATFDKFGGALGGHAGQGLATVAARARAQHESYLEVLTTPRFGDARAAAGAVAYTDDFATLRQRLIDAGLLAALPKARADLDALVAQEHAADPSAVPLIRYDVQVLRAMSPPVVFAQLLLGFELMRDDPRWVGLNMVQPEDDYVALRDYRLQMRMIRYLRTVYPAGHVTLHAGELTTRLARPEDLRFHIRDAVEVAGAERIGHGVDIRGEINPGGLAREMAKRGVLVEVPLVSNEQILGVRGRAHPLRFYLRHHVPVALATDDEGVSRTDLTEQYELAVRRHGLGYRSIKRIAIDSLRHAFLPDAEKARLLREQARAFARFESRWPG